MSKRPTKNKKKQKYDAARYHLVKDKKRLSAQEWYEGNKDAAKEYRRGWFLKKKYGITAEEYDALEKEQGGKCGLCGGPPNGKGRLHVDHCHKTGKIRKLLCYSCNSAIGLLNEDLELIDKLKEYLLAYSAS